MGVQKGTRKKKDDPHSKWVYIKQHQEHLEDDKSGGAGEVCGQVNLDFC